MVVLNTERPVRCKAVFKSNTHGATPAGRACRGQFNAGNVIEDAKAVACHCGAALYVQQRCIPGVADLAGKEADAIGFGASGERRIDQADARVVEIRPIALGFQAKHPLIGLPAITDLAAEEAPGPPAAGLTEGSQIVSEIHAVVALAPAAVGADIKAGPVVNRRQHWRGWPCLDGHIRSGCGGGDADQCCQTNRSQKKFLHFYSPCPSALTRPRQQCLRCF